MSAILKTLAIVVVTALVVRPTAMHRSRLLVPISDPLPRLYDSGEDDDLWDDGMLPFDAERDLAPPAAPESYAREIGGVGAFLSSVADELEGRQLRLRFREDEDEEDTRPFRRFGT